MVGIPEETYDLLRKVAHKKGRNVVEVFSDALNKYALENLSPAEREGSLQEQRKLLTEDL